MSVYFGSTSGYLHLDSWVLSKVLQLSTFTFCRRFLNRDNDPGGKQFGQTTGAARAVPANIAEGSARHQTSTATEMELLDVARGSVSEVVDDLMFFLMISGEEVWANDDPRAIAVREIRLDKAEYGASLLHDVAAHVERQRAKFAPWTENDDLMVCANALVVLCCRIIKMLRNQMGARLDEFSQQGGFSENLTETRLKARQEQATASNAPTCPHCGAPMVRRMTKKGHNAGLAFWGCSNWPSTGCPGKLPYGQDNPEKK